MHEYSRAIKELISLIRGYINKNPLKKFILDGKKVSHEKGILFLAKALVHLAAIPGPNQTMYCKELVFYYLHMGDHQNAEKNIQICFNVNPKEAMNTFQHHPAILNGMHLLSKDLFLKLNDANKTSVSVKSKIRFFERSSQVQQPPEIEIKKTVKMTVKKPGST
jgi:hypothetical protein